VIEKWRLGKTRIFYSKVLKKELKITMKIIDYIDVYIENFANLIKRGEGWIEKDDVLRQFTTMFDDFESSIFNKEELEKYVIDSLKNWYGIAVI